MKNPKKKKRLSKADVKAHVKTPLSVDKFEVPGEGLRFAISFSITIPEGTNNFEDMSDVVDKEMLDARNRVLKKVAQHLGADVTFTN